MLFHRRAAPQWRAPYARSCLSWLLALTYTSCLQSGPSSSPSALQTSSVCAVWNLQLVSSAQVYLRLWLSAPAMQVRTSHSLGMADTNAATPGLAASVTCGKQGCELLHGACVSLRRLAAIRLCVLGYGCSHESLKLGQLTHLPSQQNYCSHLTNPLCLFYWNHNIMFYSKRH